MSDQRKEEENKANMIGNSDISLDGIFIAKVLDNQDTQGRERLFVRVLGVHDTSDQFTDKEFGLWVDRCVSNPYSSGGIPKIDDNVYMQFLKDSTNEYNPMVGIWLGGVRENSFYDSFFGLLDYVQSGNVKKENVQEGSFLDFLWGTSNNEDRILQAIKEDYDKNSKPVYLRETFKQLVSENIQNLLDRIEFEKEDD